MSTPTLRRALLARLPRRDDETGSMPMLMLVIVATLALGGLMLSMVLNQTSTTRFVETRVHALHAAQTGIDIVLGQIRDATQTDPNTGVTTGDDSQLPCGPWSGSAANTGTMQYSSSITYYNAMPLTSANKMTCTSAGPYFAGSPPIRTPHFAVIHSTGTDGSGNSSSVGRTIETTYIFKTNDMNIAGGTIMIYPAGSAHFCMDASATPTVGTPVLVQPCSTTTPPNAAQVWAYRQDLSIELVSTAALTTPLCLDTGALPTSHAAGNQILLEPCKVSDVTQWCGAGVTPAQYAAANSGQACVAQPMCPAGTTPAAFAANPPAAGETCQVSPWNQEWSVNNSAHLEGSKTDRSDTDGYCINDSAQTAGTALSLAACTINNITDTAQTWVPSPTTGAGMAGAGNQQLVNYQHFATCLDVKGQNVNTPFLQLYTCKQNPDPTKVLWNQRFTPSPALGKTPTTVLLKVTNTVTATTYCLKSPLTAAGYPILAACPSTATGNTAGFAWTVYPTVAAYADRYTIKDSSGPPGLCLSSGLNSDLTDTGYYKVIVTGCTGGTEQKWNALPSGLDAALTNTHEVATVTS